ncbi:MAG: sialidase family protein, partial [Terriglobia bacterium]
GAEHNELSVQVGQTVEITYSLRKCWFPTVHQFSNGDLMATMRMSPDEVNPEGDFSAYCLSKDGGVTWSRRYTMGAGANVDGAWSQSPRSDGSIWQLYGWVDPHPPGQAQNFYVTRTEFFQSGSEVHQRRNVALGTSEPVQMRPCRLYDRRVQDGELASQPDVMPWGPILESLGGGLIAPVYYTAAHDPRFYRLALLRSDDQGETWREGATIAAVAPGEKPWPGMGEEGPCEAGIVRLADGRLFAMFRTGGDGFIGVAWSSDGGHRWTPPASLPYKGVALRVRRLTNGVLACSTGRPGPVVLMFSVDGAGATWSHITPIFTGKSTHYTDFVEVEPGKLLVVYDSVPYGWYDIPFADRNSKNVIYGTFVEVRRE